MDFEPSRELDVLANRVIGAAIEVHRLIGPGFTEAVYEEALCHELMLRSIPFSRQHAINLTYKGHPIGQGRLDILVDGQLILELKAVEMVLAIHKAQLHSYLKATNLKLGLLINFNVPLLKNGIKRIIAK